MWCSKVSVFTVEAVKPKNPVCMPHVFVPVAVLVYLYNEIEIIA